MINLVTELPLTSRHYSQKTVLGHTYIHLILEQLHVPTRKYIYNCVNALPEETDLTAEPYAPPRFKPTVVVSNAVRWSSLKGVGAGGAGREQRTKDKDPRQSKPAKMAKRWHESEDVRLHHEVL